MRQYLQGPSPVRVRAWDGSEAGPADAPLVVLRSRRALRHLLWQPGELGLARAYVTGDLEVPGDLRAGLSAALRTVRAQGTVPRSSLSDKAAALKTLARLGAVGPKPPVPSGEVRLRGAPHSRGRDRHAISHHYDLPPEFYALLLDPAMAYSCGYWSRPPGESGYSLAEAQRDKLELVCRKLGLRPGMRLLDVGCGWGSLSLYAAEQHGVQVTAVTLAREQAEYVREQARQRKLEELVDVQHRDYRDIPGGWYEAAVSLEMGEHVGDAEYPGFAAMMHRMLRPQGRVLIQQMSRGANAPGGGAFIEAYIAADMHMRPVGETVGLLENAGLEVRSVDAMREHYTLTIDAWARTLERNWDEVVALTNEETARAWRLYLAGGGLAFEERRMGVDQILAVRPTEDGTSGLTGTLRDWYKECAPR
nr:MULTISPECIES: cyclopropane-fatty-acyl-phospholipid synthase family protein [Streptomyces]